MRAPDGTITAFDPAGSVDSQAYSINGGRAITGFYRDSNNVWHGFVRAADGTIRAFDPPGSIYTIGASINGNGAIAGSYEDSGGTFHGFLRSR